MGRLPARRAEEPGGLNLAISGAAMTLNSLSTFCLDQKVALVTGASAGLGMRIARVLDAAGATVVVAARRLERLSTLASELERAEAVQCDLGEPDGADRLVREALDRCGHIDIVVNNAGRSQAIPALRETPESFRQLLEVNLVAPFAVARSAAAAMRERGHGGSIVNIGSAASVRSKAALPQAAYVAAKTALVGLTRELAVQWARYDIRVNSIAPGLFPTEMTEGLIADSVRLDAMAQHIPLGRAARIDEIDGMVLFLASAASSYVTGQTFLVDGGSTLV